MEGTAFLHQHSADKQMINDIMTVFATLPCSDGGYTANLIKSEIKKNVSKVEVNRALYALKDKGVLEMTPASPPLWALKKTVPCARSLATISANGADPRTHVICDLGCNHDCLQNLIPYAERGEITVKAYADIAFNGFGVNPAPVSNNVQVFQAATPDKNSADVRIIWDVSRLVEKTSLEEPDRRLDIFVCTKDLQFQSLKALVEMNPLHKLIFCTNWAALRMYIE